MEDDINMNIRKTGYDSDGNEIYETPNYEAIIYEEYLEVFDDEDPDKNIPGTSKSKNNDAVAYLDMSVPQNIYV